MTPTLTLTQRKSASSGLDGRKRTRLKTISRVFRRVRVLGHRPGETGGLGSGGGGVSLPDPTVPRWCGQEDRARWSVAMMIAVELCWLGAGLEGATNSTIHCSPTEITSLKTSNHSKTAVNPLDSAQCFIPSDPLMTAVNTVHLKLVSFPHRCSNLVLKSLPFIGFTWGDPHFQTVDGLTYTFNGYGEYVLLQSDANNLTVQTRLVGVDMNSTGTVFSAVVVVQGSVQPVQVDLSEGSVFAYVNGTPVDIPSEEDEGLIITESRMYASLMEFSGDEQNSMSSEYISLTSSDENIIISTSTGASVMVSSSSFALHLAVEVNDAFVNSTKGLLGYLNEDTSDDFYRPDGTILSRNSSERDIFDYGISCEYLFPMVDIPC